MSVTSNLLIALLLAASASTALAGTVCVRNRDGVAETWQTNERDASLFRSTDSCKEAHAVPSRPNPAPFVNAVPAPFATTAMASTLAPRAGGVQTWITSPADNNMRQLIQRWSGTVGWSLVWSVDKDIPLDSSDQTTGDFRSAVRRLLASTSLSDITLKPCFYTNNVVRVVRETAKCNPNE